MKGGFENVVLTGGMVHSQGGLLTGVPLYDELESFTGRSVMKHPWVWL